MFSRLYLFAQDKTGEKIISQVDRMFIFLTNVEIGKKKFFFLFTDLLLLNK
jgi:hypothetical protein